MKLFLCSSIITPNLKQDFENFIGRKTEGLKVLFVTTAGNPNPDKSWIAEDRDPLIENLGFKIEEIDIEKIQGEELREKITQFDVLWMNGGYTGYLMQQVKKSGLEEFLPELLQSGLVYAGSSAGSMICSESLEIADWYIGEEEPGASKISGLGYLSFQIYPHFRNELLDEIKKNKDPKEQYVLLRNGQAVSYEDGKVLLYGEKVVMLGREINHGVKR